MIEEVMANAKALATMYLATTWLSSFRASMEAYTKNPTLGDQRDVTPDRPDGNSAAMEVDDEIAQWERDNCSRAAAHVPPRYALIQQLQEENGQMKGMMQDMMSRANGVNQEAEVKR